MLVDLGTGTRTKRTRKGPTSTRKLGTYFVKDVSLHIYGWTMDRLRIFSLDTTHPFGREVDLVDDIFLRTWRRLNLYGVYWALLHPPLLPSTEFFLVPYLLHYYYYWKGRKNVLNGISLFTSSSTFPRTEISTYRWQI